MAWSDIVNGLVSTGKGAGEIYNAFKSDNSSEEAAYLKGANEALASQLQQQRDDSRLTIGDTSISTNGLLWIVAGTLGLLAIGLTVKKMI